MRDSGVMDKFTFLLEGNDDVPIQDDTGDSRGIVSYNLSICGRLLPMLAGRMWTAAVPFQ